MFVSPAGGQLAGCVAWQIFNIGHYAQTFSPNFFIPAMFLDAIDFYHVVQLSATLILAGGHKVNTKRNFLS